MQTQRELPVLISNLIVLLSPRPVGTAAEEVDCEPGILTMGELCLVKFVFVMLRVLVRREDQYIWETYLREQDEPG